MKKKQNDIFVNLIKGVTPIKKTISLKGAYQQLIAIFLFKSTETANYRRLKQTIYLRPPTPINLK